MEYFDTLVDRAERSGVFLRMYHENTDDWLDYETLCRATALLDRAMEVTEGEDAEFVERLRRDCLPPKFVWLKGYHKFKQYAEKTGENFCGPADPVELWKDFFEVCEKYKVSSYAEGANAKMFANLKETLFCQLTAKPTPAPEEFKKLDSNEWTDYQEYDFRILWGEHTLIDDPAASNGRALKLLQFFYNVPLIEISFTDCPLFDDSGADTEYRAIVYIRCDAAAQNAPTFSLEIFDKKENKTVMQKRPMLSEIAGSQYTKIEFEPLPLTRNMSIRVRTGEIKEAYIDRILVIKGN